MSQTMFRYQFDETTSMENIEALLVLSLFSIEALHGEARTRLAIEHAFDAEKRSCVIRADNAIGRNLIRLFTGHLIRELGPDSFRVERVPDR